MASRGRAGRPSRYDEDAVRTWMGERDVAAAAASQGACTTFADARMRKELAQAAEAEQRVAMRAGRLIAVEEVDRVWSTQVAAVRARLLAMPTALADRLHRVAVTAGPAGVEAVLQAATYEALRELAGGPAVPTTNARTRKPRGKARRPRQKKKTGRTRSARA